MRHALLLVHRYAGLGMALFLVIAGLTGSLIAFSHELDVWLNPELYQTSRTGRSLSFSQIAQHVEQSDPRLRVGRLTLPSKRGQAVIAWVEPRIDPATGRAFQLDFNEVFIDPVTGEIRGHRQWGALRFDRAHTVSVLNRLHDRLHLPGDWGRWFMGGLSIVWLIDCFVGFYLTLPRRQRFLAGWRRSWLVGHARNLFRLSFDLHRAGGLWLWILLIILALSSFSLNLRYELFRPLVSMFSPVTLSIFDLRRPDPEATWPALDFNAAAAIGRARANAFGWKGEVAEIAYISDVDVFILQFEKGGFWHEDTRWLFLDGQDGHDLGEERVGMGTAGDLFTLVQFPLHSGRLFGMAGRIAISIIGVAVAGLAVTGIIIWERKWRARTRKRPQAA